MFGWPHLRDKLGQGPLTGGGGDWAHRGKNGNEGWKGERSETVDFSKRVTQKGGPVLLTC